MGEIIMRDVTGNQATFDYNIQATFLGNNRFIEMQYTNSTGSELTLAKGQVMGRIAATQKALPLVATATDGSQYPVGLNVEPITVADGATVTINVCIAGEVVEGHIVFSGAETMNTIVSDRILRDRLASDTLGIIPVVTSDATNYDN